jgi:tRNA threonylcarbamoyladenosine biosynthesis protein TsaB
MKLLAMDAASAACSAALFADGDVVALREKAMDRGHAEALVPMVAAVLEDARAACPGGFADLDAIAVTIGPGAFTGVRIGLATAAAMAAAAGIPVIGLTTLEVVAAAPPADGPPRLVALDSKRSDVYAQLFGGPADGPLAAPQAILPDAIPALLPAGPLALAGDGAAPVAAALRAAGHPFTALPGPGRPEAPVLARLAVARAARDGLPAAPPRPLYLRAPDVTLPPAAKRRQ